MERYKLEELLEKMTIHEKIGQMTQIPNVFYLGFSTEKVKIETLYSKNVLQGENLNLIGSVIAASGAKTINQIQKQYLESSRLKIPLLFAHDAIHGYKTIFPIPLGLSCSWDEELLRRIAEVTATELRAAGININLAPMVDLVRDSRWGRVMESFGEDHLLAGKLGAAAIKGYQKGEEGHIGKDGVAAALKHFGACGGAIAGKEYNTVDMSRREFLDYYGKPYEIAIEAEPKFVMSAFNAFNGMPATANEELMNDILRELYGFEGVTISDWGSVIELTNHRVAANNQDAASLALNSGTDIEMSSATYLENCEVILAKNPDLIQYIDEVVMKILELKNELGLFEQPFVDEAREADMLMNEAAMTLANESAKAACVLLKNENNLLPITDDYRNILVIGPFAKTKELLGSWSCEGEFNDVISVENGMEQVFKNRLIGTYTTLEEVPSGVIGKADYIIITIGEHWDNTGEARSSINLELTFAQKELIKAVKQLNIPYACVAFSGRPLALQSVIRDIPALLWAWYPGTQAGLAVAELLAGNDSPSGKLTMSFPRYSAQIPIYYNEYSSGRPSSISPYSNRYQDCEPGPLFNFGHGLNYAEITYNDLSISSAKITEENPIVITIEVENKSKFQTAETVIVYLEDVISRAIRPVREMKKWAKVKLEPFERKRIEIVLTVDDLSYLNEKLEQVVEPGEFNIFVNDLSHVKFTLSY